MNLRCSTKILVCLHTLQRQTTGQVSPVSGQLPPRTQRNCLQSVSGRFRKLQVCVVITTILLLILQVAEVGKDAKGLMIRIEK